MSVECELSGCPVLITRAGDAEVWLRGREQALGRREWSGPQGVLTGGPGSPGPGASREQGQSGQRPGRTVLTACKARGVIQWRGGQGPEGDSPEGDVSEGDGAWWGRWAVLLGGGARGGAGLLNPAGQ